MDASSLSSIVSATNLAAQNAQSSNSANGASAAGSTSSGSTDAFSNITSNDFLKMMIAQLQNQDPMNPMDDSQLLQQISQIRDIQASTELSTTLNGLSVGQNLASASALINKNVTALDTGGNSISGVVQSVAMTNGQPQLVINGSNVSLSNIKSIQPETATVQTTQDADADTLLQNIQNLLTNGVLTQDKSADQSLSNLQQILLAAANGSGTTGNGTTGDTTSGDSTGDGSTSGTGGTSGN